MASLPPELPCDIETLQAMLISREAEIERLRRSPRNCSGIASAAGPRPCPRTSFCWGWRRPSRSKIAAAEKAARARQRRANRGALPAHLPRIEMMVDIEGDVCPCCSGKLHRIGEDVAERLDIVPAQFRVLVLRRPKYACGSCEDVVVQAPAPARLIEGGISTEATVAQLLVSKCADHLPLYCQAQIYARQGVARSIARRWPTGSGARLPVAARA